ncbi:hypothetical protein [Sphingomonas sp. PAMC 26605]|uniref:hypothetical protein n=1 Tax=Sphingomonas sp. PAMC 26605 TaxID=1112214 RepID=UPI00026CB5A5|nr:hypothetical protein [Sphingomonas sp. PAMC 26605]
MPFRKLFLSRWSALLWAGGILWTAVDTVGFGPAAKTPATVEATPANTADQTDATGTVINSDDLAVLANALGPQ